MVLVRRVALTVFPLVLVATVGCSKDSKPAASSTGGSVAPVSSAGFSSAPPPSSTDSSSGPCSGPAVPASAVDVTRADGDFNGDQVTDTLTVYGTGTASEPAPYHVQIELANSLGRIDDAIVDAATEGAGNVKALGGSDITASAGLPPDGSGDEAFVEVGSGASDALVGVFQLVGCTLTRITGPQGQAPSQFAVGGSVTHLDGIRCDGTAGGQKLTQLSATSDDGQTYKTTETRLRVESGHFVQDSPPLADSIDAGDPTLQGFSNLDCTGVQAP